MNQVIDIKNCSGCKKSHDGLEYHKMKKTLYDTGETYTHYAICPETKRMILIKKEDVDGRVEKQNS